MLHGVQLARSLAAYGVVFFHLASELAVRAGYSGDPFTVGRGGVDLFFVISGFIMVHVTREDETPWDFMAKRLFRIAPIYWLATTLALLLVTLRPWLFEAAIVTPETIAASYAFVPMFDANGDARPILFLGWTLNYEMMFYALFALALFVPKMLQVQTVVALMFVLMTAAPYLPHAAAAQVYSQPIMLEFVAGCLIGAALKTRWMAAALSRIPVWPITTLGAALFLVSGLYPDTLPDHLQYGVPACVLLFGLAAQDLHRSPMGANVLSRLGDASYSLYLLHIFIFKGLSLVYFPLVGTGGWAMLGFAIMAVGGATALSLLSHRLIEQPSNDWLRRRWTRATRPSVA